MKVFHHDSIDPALLTVKKRRSTGAYTLYIDDGSPVLLQAVGRLVYNPSIYLNGYTSFCIESDASATVARLSDRVSRLCPAAPQAPHLRLYNYNRDAIGCFDYDDSLFDVHRLSRGERIAFIFQAEGFSKGQPLLKLWQVKRLSCTSAPGTPLFINASQAPPTKYERMLRMGVPEAAVQQKMRLDGLLPPPPPPPPPPGPPPPPPPIGPGMARALADIKAGNFTLKKAAAQAPSKSLLLERLSASAKHEPPSLEDILKARSQLRKIM